MRRHGTHRSAVTPAKRPGMTRFMRTVASHSNDPTQVPAPPPTSADDDALLLVQRGALHRIAGAALTGFSAGLVQLYLKTPGMRQDGDSAAQFGS